MWYEFFWSNEDFFCIRDSKGEIDIMNKKRVESVNISTDKDSGAVEVSISFGRYNDIDFSPCDEKLVASIVDFFYDGKKTEAK